MLTSALVAGDDEISFEPDEIIENIEQVLVQPFNLYIYIVYIQVTSVIIP